MSNRIRRSYYLFTDNQEEAIAELQKQKAIKGNSKVAMAEQQNMLDPPKTPHKYIVFKIIE